MRLSNSISLFLLLLLGLICVSPCPTLEAARFPKPSRSSAVDDEAARRVLVGEWDCKFREGDFVLESRISFRTDGSFSEAGYFETPDGRTEYSGTGSWEIESGFLIYHVENSSIPAIPPRVEMLLTEAGPDRIRYEDAVSGLAFELLRSKRF